MTDLRHTDNFRRYFLTSDYWNLSLLRKKTIRHLPMIDVGRHVETRSTYVAPEASRGRLKQQAEAEARGRSSALNKQSGCHTV
jgi:hypothetical protein